MAKMSVIPFTPNFNISNLLIATFIFAPIQASRIKLRKTMTAAEIVPDIIGTVPEHYLQVKYSTGVEVKLGNQLTPTAVRFEPAEVEWRANRSDFYTLLMVNPDAPSRADPKMREGLHWLVVNIPGHDLAKGETYVEYLSAGPAQEAGLCRYVFLIYRQAGLLKLERAKTSNTSLEGRFGFKTRDFGTENNLSGPVAGNFFEAKYDEFVPVLFERLGYRSGDTGEFVDKIRLFSK